MNKTEITQLFKKIKIRYPAFAIPADVEGAREMVEEWLIDLQHVPLDTAVRNLREYAKHPEHKFAPHPGILAVMSDNQDRYASLMKELGQENVMSVEQMQANAVPISEEQRRKVRELFE